MAKVLFLRHGVRQTNVKSGTEPLPDTILQLAAASNLNLAGYKLSYNFRYFYKRNIWNFRYYLHGRILSKKCGHCHQFSSGIR